LNDREVPFTTYDARSGPHAYFWGARFHHDYEDALRAVRRRVSRGRSPGDPRWALPVWEVADPDRYVESMKAWLHGLLGRLATDQSVQDEVFQLDRDALRTFERLEGRDVFTPRRTGTLEGSFELVSAIDGLAMAFVSQIGPNFPSPTRQVFTLSGTLSELDAHLAAIDALAEAPEL
jgi:hypothetical protein